MKDAKKDRDPMKARKRAKNDASTAIRKLAEWADELGQDGAARDLRAARESILAMAERLGEISERKESQRDAA